MLVNEDPVIPQTKERQFQTETDGLESAKIQRPECAVSIKKMKGKSTGLQNGEKEKKHGIMYLVRILY